MLASSISASKSILKSQHVLEHRIKIDNKPTPGFTHLTKQTIVYPLVMILKLRAQRKAKGEQFRNQQWKYKVKIRKPLIKGASSFMFPRDDHNIWAIWSNSQLRKHSKTGSSHCLLIKKSVQGVLCIPHSKCFPPSISTNKVI